MTARKDSTAIAGGCTASSPREMGGRRCLLMGGHVWRGYPQHVDNEGRTWVDRPLDPAMRRALRVRVCGHVGTNWHVWPCAWCERALEEYGTTSAAEVACDAIFGPLLAWLDADDTAPPLAASPRARWRRENVWMDDLRGVGFGQVVRGVVQVGPVPQAERVRAYADEIDRHLRRHVDQELDKHTDRWPPGMPAPAASCYRADTTRDTWTSPPPADPRELDCDPDRCARCGAPAVRPGAAVCERHPTCGEQAESCPDCRAACESWELDGKPCGEPDELVELYPGGPKVRPLRVPG